MMMMIMIVQLVLLKCAHSANSFICYQQRRLVHQQQHQLPSLQLFSKAYQRRLSTQQQQQQSSFVTRLYLSSNRKDEIAKLEEQLRQLKVEQEKQESLASTETDNDIAVKSSEVQRKLEKIQGKDMILSEQELIAGGIVELDTDDSSNNPANGFGSIVTIAGAVVGLLLLIAFAQVPVGQEGLSQYSATGSSVTAFKQIDLGDLNAEKTPSK